MKSIERELAMPDVVLKVTFTHGEFELIRWAQRMCRQSKEKRRSIGVAQFARGALLEAVGNTIDEVLGRPGGFIPPELAGYWEEWSRKTAEPSRDLKR